MFFRSQFEPSYFLGTQEGWQGQSLVVQWLPFVAKCWRSSFSKCWIWRKRQRCRCHPQVQKRGNCCLDAVSNPQVIRPWVAFSWLVLLGLIVIQSLQGAIFVHLSKGRMFLVFLINERINAGGREADGKSSYLFIRPLMGVITPFTTGRGPPYNLSHDLATTLFGMITGWSKRMGFPSSNSS